ncbi:MAG: DbpA RNA binding domain-containing protein [Gemmatimonadota bacterium]
MARSQHVVHVLSPGDARVASVLGPQVQRAGTEGTGVQVLVVTPSAETAAWLARLVNPTVEGGQPLLVPVTSPTRGARRVSSGARAVAVTPADALALVRGSALKLEGVSTLVLIDANELLASNGDAVATLLSEIPRTADRVMVTGTVDTLVSSFLEAHMRRPRTITHDILPTAGGSLQYVVTSRGDRANALRRVLDMFDPPRATLVTTEEHTGAATRALASLGYGAEDTLVRIRTGAIDSHEPLLISFGAPQDAAELQRLADSTPQATVVFVAPEELASFLRLAGPRATPLALTSAPAAAHAAEDVLRDELRAVMQSRTLHRETLALEPLLGEHDALEVAAAALRMLELERERARAKRPAPRAAELPTVPAPSERVAPVGTSYTKLFINVGERDGAKKGDFVGAITGEAGVAAEQIGKVDLRDSHTIVDVASDMVEKVIAALNGSTICGRHVLAREDRGPTEREGGEREARGGFRSAERPSFRSGPPRSGPPRGGPPRSGGYRGNDRGDRGDRSDRGERSDRGAPRGDRPSFRGGSDRNDRGDRGGDRGPRSGGFRSGGFRGGSSGGSGGGGGFRGGSSGGGGFRTGGNGASSGGFRSGGGSGGGFRGPDRGADRDRGAPRGGEGGGYRGDRDRGPSAGGPSRRNEDRPETGGPRAINESREWSERGDRLRNARGRRED